MRFSGHQFVANHIWLGYFTFLILVCPPFAGLAHAEAPGAIVLGSSAGLHERLAASELASYLGRMYRGQRFDVRTADQDILSEIHGASHVILMGTPETFPALATRLGPAELDRPGGFVVRIDAADSNLALIAGADGRAVLHGVYGLLERLGCGFYLSYEVVPTLDGPFDYNGWDLADAPLTGDRIVFDWHNFVSGCSGWNLEDWRQWVRHSARMRFTDVMVHAYNNNPMVTFVHNGVERPVGYLATSAKGRDWSTTHLNDVRRIPGAEGLYDGPVFGSDAALVPDGQRVAAAKDLIGKVSEEAVGMGLRVDFAIDVDTGDDPAMLGTLPESAKFTVEGSQTLVNPDTPEGYAYYRDRVLQLMETYPQIGRVVVWSRWMQSTPWTRLKPEDFPGNAWREAFRRALDEADMRDVELAIGTWEFDHLRAADAFMPEGVMLMALDYSRIFDTDKAREILA